MHESLYVRITERFHLLLKSKYVSSIAKITPQLKISYTAQDKTNGTKVKSLIRNARLYE
jgi:hypothetical protein